MSRLSEIGDTAHDIRQSAANLVELTKGLSGLSPEIRAAIATLSAKSAGLVTVVTDSAQDAHAIIEGLKDAPAWTRTLFELLQGDAEKALAAIGRFGTLAEKLTAIAVNLRDGQHVHLKGLNFGTELTIGGEFWIE